MRRRAIGSLSSVAACAALLSVATAAGAANYTLAGKFTANRGRDAQVPVIGATSCGGLTFMSGPGAAGTMTPATHPVKVGINTRGGLDLGCMPNVPGVKLVTTGKGVGGAFTLPAKAFNNPGPMTTINAISASGGGRVRQFARATP